MRNIRLTLAYDGTAYVGWQVQPNGLSVQAVVEEAIERLIGRRVRLYAAGRTDAGVHALGQVANFRTDVAIPCHGLRAGLQRLLPSDVAVCEVAEVAPDFHATFSARRKRYRYVIHNRRVPDPFVRRYAWHFGGRLDAAAMHEAAQVLLGTHDFRSFESHFPNKSTSVRTVVEATVARHAGWPVWTQPNSLSLPPEPNGDFVWFDIVADGFLYNMVRAITGTLLKVGLRRWTAGRVREVLETQDRTFAGDTAPPQGLYLVKVEYDLPPRAPADGAAARAGS